MEFNKIFFRPPKSTYTQKDFSGPDRYFEVPTDNVTNGKKLQLNIPCVLMPNMLGKEMISKYYIVYFHGNAEDLGTSYDFLYDIRACVKCNIVLTEYCGYGLYKDLSSNTKQIEYDAEKIIQYLINTLQIPKQHIILLGRSMGSGPACLIASKYKTRGLMLISAFTSLKDVATNMVGFLSKLVSDRFKNIEYIESVKCPVLLIHGKMDKLVPYTHSQKLADKLICDVMECYQEGMTHNDYDIDDDIIKNMVLFLKDKMNIFQKKNDPILSKFENVNQPKFYIIYPEMKPKDPNDPKIQIDDIIQITKNIAPNIIINNVDAKQQQQEQIALQSPLQSPNNQNLANLLNQFGEEELENSCILVQSNEANQFDESQIEVFNKNLDQEKLIEIK